MNRSIDDICCMYVDVMLIYDRVICLLNEEYSQGINTKRTCLSIYLDLRLNQFTIRKESKILIMKITCPHSEIDIR